MPDPQGWTAGPAPTTATGWTAGPAPKQVAQAAAPAKPTTGGAVAVMQGAAKVAPVIQRVIEEVATNPNVPRVMSRVGQGAGFISGVQTRNPLNVAGGMWAGGRAGWFTGKLAQNLMMPVAKAAEVLAPYVQTLGTLSGAQGALDLAQMAEPNRKDIGFFGMSLSSKEERAERDKFRNDWTNWMATYPRSVGKERWSALKPTERKEAFDTFMASQKGTE